jgi:hypothetical protein
MPAIASDIFKTAGRTILCALCCLWAAAVPVTAEEVPAVASEYVMLNEGDRVRALLLLIHNGRHDEAEALLRHYPLTGKFAANRTLYIEGLLAKARGQPRVAVDKFRAALASDPSLTLVRAELAETLVGLDENESAVHHLELLRSEAPDEVEARRITSFIDSIDAKRPWSVSSYVSVAPSTNINNGTANDKIYVFGLPFDIDPGSKKTSGIGLSAGLSGAYTWKLDEDIAAVVGAGLNGRVYKESDFNQLTASQSAELRYLQDWGYAGLGVVGSQSVSGSDIDLGYWSVGPRGTLSYRFNPQDSIFASSTLEFRTYPENDVYDGIAILNQWTFSHAFDSSFVGYVGGGLDRIETNADHLDYWSYAGSIGAYKEWPWGVTANYQFEYRRSVYDADYPLMSDPRRDNRYSASISLTKRDFDILGYAPQIEYTYTRNGSNVVFYDYDSHTVEFRLTKDF